MTATERDLWRRMWDVAPAALTPRQLEHLRLWAAGRNLREAAEELGVSRATVADTRHRIGVKLAQALDRPAVPA